jgi:hypothetical protein
VRSGRVATVPVPTLGQLLHALLALAALRRLRSLCSRCACAFRHSLGCRRVIGRVAPKCALLGLRTTWGEPSASKLGGRDCGLGVVPGRGRLDGDGSGCA